MKASITITCRNEHVPLFSALLGDRAEIEPADQVLGLTSAVYHPEAFAPGEFTLPIGIPCHGTTGGGIEFCPRAFAYDGETLTIVPISEHGEPCVPCPEGAPNQEALAALRLHLTNWEHVEAVLLTPHPPAVLT